MIRNVAREIAMHLSFELSFTDLPAEELLDRQLPIDLVLRRGYIRRLVSGIAEHSYELDRYIEKYSKGWRFERIPLVASAIMRLAMFEILYMPEIPNGAAINEAVEIAKKYESPDVVRFINGILGSFVRGEAAEAERVPAAEPSGAEE